MTDVTRELAAFASGLTYEALPPEVVDRAKILFADLSGIIVRAQQLDSSLSMISGLRALGQGSGTARVMGNAGGWTPSAAALLAGAAAHSLDFDDTHARTLLHPGAPVVPAALAAAQIAEASTRDVLVGMVAGYEVMIRVAAGVNPMAHSERGHHLTATTGVFGAVAAAGSVLGLDPGQMAHAFGTALSETAGTGQFAVNGAWTKRYHVGAAAAAGLNAAVLAAHGYTGAAQAFEGKEGFFNVYSPDPKPEQAVAGLGRDWEILQSGIKPYPCCRGIHAPLDAVFALLGAHEVAPDQIETVRVGMAARSVYVVGAPQERRRNPKNVVDCQFSTHLCVATALVTGELGWDSYEPALVSPEIHALMQRIEVAEDAECEANFPGAFSAVVEIDMRDGRRLRQFVYNPKGEPDDLPDATEQRRKWDLLTVPVLGEVGSARLWSAIRSMDQTVPVTTLFEDRPLGCDGCGKGCKDRDVA